MSDDNIIQPVQLACDNGVNIKYDHDLYKYESSGDQSGKLTSKKARAVKNALTSAKNSKSKKYMDINNEDFTNPISRPIEHQQQKETLDPLDIPENSPHNVSMTDYVTTRELDSKLSGIEERMDRRIENMANSVDLAIKSINEKTTHFDETVKEIRTELKDNDNRGDERYRATRNWSIGIGLTVVSLIASIMGGYVGLMSARVSDQQKTAQSIEKNVNTMVQAVGIQQYQLEQIIKSHDSDAAKKTH